MITTALSSRAILRIISHIETVVVLQEGMSCDSYRYKPTLQDDMKRADLVISHAGAGSIMEALGEFNENTDDIDIDNILHEI